MTDTKTRHEGTTLMNPLIAAIVHRGGNTECRCGHTRFGHSHFSSSTHCALCDCARYRRAARSIFTRWLP